MNMALKSSRLTALLAGAVLLGLAGCEDFRAPRIFDETEVPPEILSAPRLVAAPSAPGSDSGWPRLGDVPSKPDDFTPHPLAEQSIQQMQDYRIEAETLKDRAEDMPPEPEAPRN